MEERKDFITFFSDILQEHISEFSVKDDDVAAAIREIHFAYSTEAQFQSNPVKPVDYDNPAYRCAYLHKYAGFHAKMVHHILSLRVQYKEILRNIPWREHDVMNICCLGGGPGSDICGFSKTLQELEVKKLRLTMIDVMEGWASTFRTLLKVAQFPGYSDLNTFLSGIICEEYIRDDLLSPGNETKRALESADLVTMVKFVSTVKQHQAVGMLKVLFRWMKLGAVVFFIDNAAGGFLEKVSEAAKSCGFEIKCDSFQTRFTPPGKYRFGFRSISSTTVAVQMWKKVHRQDLQQENFRCEDEGSSKQHVKKVENCESRAVGENQPYDDPCVSVPDASDKTNSQTCKLNSEKSHESKSVPDSDVCIRNPDDGDPHESGCGASSSAKVQRTEKTEKDREINYLHFKNTIHEAN